MSWDIAIWFYQPQLWMILGILLILLELNDGTKIFFLPMGLGAIVMAAWIYLFKESVIPHSWLSGTWYVVIIHWALMALVFGVALANWRRMKRGKNTKEEPDINEY